MNLNIHLSREVSWCQWKTEYSSFSWIKSWFLLSSPKVLFMHINIITSFSIILNHLPTSWSQIRPLRLERKYYMVKNYNYIHCTSSSDRNFGENRFFFFKSPRHIKIFEQCLVTKKIIITGSLEHCFYYTVTTSRGVL